MERLGAGQGDGQRRDEREFSHDNTILMNDKGRRQVIRPAASPSLCLSARTRGFARRSMDRPSPVPRTTAPAV
jgi:hypothetical protein